MNKSNANVNLLIVDDTLKNIQVLGTLLRNEGYQIHVAQNGLQALKVVETVQPGPDSTGCDDATTRWLRDL